MEIKRRPLRHPRYVINWWMSSKHNLYMSAYWTDGHVIEELLREYSLYENSIYRKIIRAMSYAIYFAEDYLTWSIEDRNKMAPPRIMPETVKLFPDEYYSLYVFHKPFINIEGLDIIHKLKIYFKPIQTHNDSKAHVIYQECEESDYCKGQHPMYKSKTGTYKIDVMSIVCKDVIDPNILYDILDRKLKHALWSIKDIKNNEQAEQATDKSKLLKQLSYDSYKRCNSPFNMNQSEVLENFAYYEYFCQDSEIESHLESMVSECMHYCNRQFTDEIKDILCDAIKQPLLETLPQFNNETIHHISQTLQLYRELYQGILKFEDKENMAQYKTEFPDDYNKVMKILYRNNIPEGATLLNNVAVYKKQIQKFLNKASDVIINLETVKDKKRH